MKEIFVNNSINYLRKNNACTDQQINVFKYTLETIYSFVTKTTVIFFLAFLLGTFKITLTLYIMYSFLRGFTFGIHATKNIYCWIVTLLVYTILPILIKYVFIPNNYLMILNILGIIAILLWAPADTPARPLLNRKKRITNKIISLLIGVIYISINYYLQNVIYSKILSTVLLLNLICLCPITYRIFHIPYNNYKNYHK